MRTIRAASVLATIVVLVGLAASLTGALSPTAPRPTPLLSWANGPGGVALEVPAPALFPGAVVTRPLVVTNPRPEPAVVSLVVSAEGDEALTRVLDVEITSGGGDCSTPTAAPTGTIAATGTAHATEPGPLRLRASSTLPLCASVSMRRDADDSVQGLHATITLRIVPEGSEQESTS